MTLKKVVGHCLKIDMIQFKWDGSKWKCFKFNGRDEI